MLEITLSGVIAKLKSSGFCVDSLAILKKLREPTLLRLATCFLRLRFSPAILSYINDLSLPADERGELFGLALSLINVGGAYKTTGEGRTPLADKAVMSRIKTVNSPRVMEVGVSDGTSALRLLESVRAVGGKLFLTDRFPTLFKRKVCRGFALYYDTEGCLMGMKVGIFWIVLSGKKSVPIDGMDRIETVNPKVNAEIVQFDMFRDRLDAPVHVVKCSNVLNTVYFTDESIQAATVNLARSLEDGGCIVVSQNHVMYPGGESYFVLKLNSGELRVVESKGGHMAERLFPVGKEG